MVSQDITPLSQPIPDGVSLPALFTEWKRNHQQRFEDFSDDELSIVYDRLDELAAQATTYRPATAADLARIFLIETEHGSEEPRRTFFEALIELANGDEGVAPSNPTIFAPAKAFEPVLDISEMPLRELRHLCDLLFALSEIVNRSIPGTQPGEKIAQVSFLDNLQAMLADYPMRIAEMLVSAPAPTDKSEAAEWSWIVSRAQVQCAEGEIFVSGRGVPAWLGGSSE